MGLTRITISHHKDGQHLVIPAELAIPGDEVYVKKVGNTLVLIPENDSWNNVISGAYPFTPDFMEDREQPAAAEERQGFKS